MALAYLLSLTAALAALAIVLRPRRVPTPPRPTIPPALSAAARIEPGTEVRVILAAAAQLADRLAPAA